MKNLFKLLVLLILFSTSLNAQTLVAVYPFPYHNPYNYFWGITQRNDTLWIGSDFDGVNYPFAYLFKVTKTGIIVDSLITPFKFNHGTAWDGTGFWIAEDYRSAGARIYKINSAGLSVDSIYTGTYAQGIGGIALDGNNLWFAVYYPDFATYPYAYAYKVNLSSKLIVDTIPLRGRQVQGIAVKGDTIFYVNDNMQSEQERIYAYRKVIGDTLFSFPAPDPDNDCDPRGLYWDGQNLYLIAYRPGSSASAYRQLYKYEISNQGNPLISTSPNSINFGNIIIGSTATQNLTISNLGNAKLIITAKNITNPRFGITPNNVPDTINPNQSKNYIMSFTPLVADSVYGELQIQSNDVLTPTKIVTLRGKGINNGSYIVLSSTSYNYNQRRVNSLCGYQFNITNTGNSPLVITSMQASTPRFRLDTTLLPFPVTIDTQKTKTFRVWFNPNAATTFTDSLTIISNAVNLPVAKLYLTGEGIIPVNNLGTIFWQGNCPTNPFTSYNDYQPVSMKQIQDVNNDGVNDIVVCSGNYLTTCYNGNSSVTADILWIFNTGYNNNNTGAVVWEDGMQIRDDVNGDGIQDVVFGCGGGNEMVYTISGRTGKLIWLYGDSINYSLGDIEAVRVDKDYNGDGVKDVLVSASGTGTGSGGRHALICLNGLTGAEIFYVTQPSDFTGDVVCTQFGGAIGNGSNSGAYAVKGFNNTGSEIWTYTTTGKIWSMREIPTINADTIKEVIGFFGFQSTVFCVSSNNGQMHWQTSFGSGNNGTIVLLDDLDSNGYIDFTMSGPQTVYRVDTKNYNALWSVNPAASYIRDATFLSDVNGDGKRDIAVSMQAPGKVIVMNGTNGNTLFEYTFGSTTTYRADRVEAVNSIDGNSTTEFLAGCRDGRIIMFSGGQGTPIGVKNVGSIIPSEYNLYQNYPNPFNPTTTIKFSIPSVSNVSEVPVVLKVFDLIGREVETLVNENLKPGFYEVKFSADKLTSGIYLYRLETPNFTSVKRMVYIK